MRFVVYKFGTPLGSFVSVLLLKQVRSPRACATEGIKLEYTHLPPTSFKSSMPFAGFTGQVTLASHVVHIGQTCYNVWQVIQDNFVAKLSNSYIIGKSCRSTGYIDIDHYVFISIINKRFCW
jgi:hypothetical protein